MKCVPAPNFAFHLTLQQTDRRFSGSSSGTRLDRLVSTTYAETIGRWDSTSTRQTTRRRNWPRSFQTKRKTGAVHAVNDAGIVFYLPLIRCVSSRGYALFYGSHVMHLRSWFGAVDVEPCSKAAKRESQDLANFICLFSRWSLDAP